MVQAVLPRVPAIDHGVLVLVVLLLSALLGLHLQRRRHLARASALEAAGRETEHRLDRYRAAFRSTEAHPAAFADRATGLVVEATPAWCVSGLPRPGASLMALDAEAWRRIPAPGKEGEPGPGSSLQLGPHRFCAQPLGGESLGLVLLLPR